MGLTLIAIACASGADMMGEVLDSGVPDAGAQPGTGEGMRFFGSSTEMVVPKPRGLLWNWVGDDTPRHCRDSVGAEHSMRALRAA